MEPLGASLGTSLGTSRSFLELLGAFLEHLGASLGASWSLLELLGTSRVDSAVDCWWTAVDCRWTAVDCRWTVGGLRWIVGGLRWTVGGLRWTAVDCLLRATNQNVTDRLLITLKCVLAWRLPCLPCLPCLPALPNAAEVYKSESKTTRKV